MEDEARRQAEEHFERGNAFDEQGWRERAISEWHQALDLDPNHAAAHFNLGIAYAENDDAEQAIDHLRAAIRLEPFDVEARSELAEVYADQGETDEAINQLRQALNVAPGDGDAAHRLAELYLDQDKWDQAASALEAGSMAEDDADLWSELGNAYAQAQRRDDAILAYQRALVCKPDHAEAQQALQRWGVPIEDQPDANVPHREAEEHFERGNTLDEQGDREGAVAEWEEALQFDPEHAAAHFNLGIAYAENDEIDSAIEHLRAAVRLNPSDVEARRELAEIYADQDQPNEAINQLRQILNVAPGDDEAAHWLAELCIDQEMWDQAESALQTAPVMQEDADLWYALGNGYTSRRRDRDAIRAYRRALACNPNHREARNVLQGWGVPIDEPHS